MTGGTVTQSIALPTYQHSGRPYGAVLNYDSGLAGSYALGAPPVGAPQAVPQSDVAVPMRGSTASAMCLPLSDAAALIASSPGSCGGGSCSLSGGLSVTPWALNTVTFGSSATSSVSLPQGANSMDFGEWASLPIQPDGTIPTEGFVHQHVT
ncbi:MAG: hypothetical protein JO243_00960, partial [Solirubrobacterales bacterium]|nr:hypothetical protein [Solirubrobacterales bacterium]